MPPSNRKHKNLLGLRLQKEQADKKKATVERIRKAEDKFAQFKIDSLAPETGFERRAKNTASQLEESRRRRTTGLGRSSTRGRAVDITRTAGASQAEEVTTSIIDTLNTSVGASRSEFLATEKFIRENVGFADKLAQGRGGIIGVRAMRGRLLSEQAQEETATRASDAASRANIAKTLKKSKKRRGNLGRASTLSSRRRRGGSSILTSLLSS